MIISGKYHFWWLKWLQYSSKKCVSCVTSNSSAHTYWRIDIYGGCSLMSSSIRYKQLYSMHDISVSVVQFLLIIYNIYLVAVCYVWSQTFQKTRAINIYVLTSTAMIGTCWFLSDDYFDNSYNMFVFVASR